MTLRPTDVATRAKARVALVTCAQLAELEADDRLVIAPLAARGIDAEAAVWDTPGVDWPAYDLVVLRSPWDYVSRRAEFLDWARGVPRLANAAETAAWNTDKRYLASLAEAGVATVSTAWVAPADVWMPPDRGEYVIKPAVGAGSLDTGRYDLGDPGHRELAVAHVGRLRAAGRIAMVQPYLAAVDSYGETAVLFLGGVYSHAIRKGPMLDGPDQGVEGLFVEGLYKEEDISPRSPSAAERELAEQVLDAVPGGRDGLLYARVDLIPGPDGSPVLVELELTEPSLFLGYADGAADRFADAIEARVRSATSLT